MLFMIFPIFVIYLCTMDKAETILNMFKVAEKEAFQLLYSSYYETLVLFANQIIDDSQAAEDIVQDCLVKFWISKRYRTLESGLDKYIFQAVKFSSLNYVRGDNMGYSHYYAEVLRVKQVAEEVAKGKNLVVVFDELFKGTNVKDAYDATVSVTEAFSMNRNCTFIISTHIIVAGHALRERLDNLHFVFVPTLMKGNVPTYPYRLEEGITDDRHGMLIINNERILEMLE